MTTCHKCHKPKRQIRGGSLEGLLDNVNLLKNAVTLVSPYSPIDMYDLPIVRNGAIENISISISMGACGLVAKRGDKAIKNLLKKHNIEINNLINKLSISTLLLLCCIDTHLGITNFIHKLSKEQLQKALMITVLFDTSKYKPVLDKIKLSSAAQTKWISETIKILENPDDTGEKFQNRILEILGMADQVLMDKSCDEGGYMTCSQTNEIYDELRATLRNIKSDSKMVMNLLKGDIGFGDIIKSGIRNYMNNDTIDDNNNNNNNRGLVMYNDLTQVGDRLDVIRYESEVGTWGGMFDSWFVNKSKAVAEEQRIIKLFLDITINAITPIMGNVHDAELIARDSSRAWENRTISALTLYGIVILVTIISSLVKRRVKRLTSE
jgi:hypothetical protein